MHQKSYQIKLSIKKLHLSYIQSFGGTVIISISSPETD